MDDHERRVQEFHLNLSASAPLDPIRSDDKGCKARTRTLIVDNDFVLMKRSSPLWFRPISFALTDGRWNFEGRGRGETCSGTFVITKDSPFFVFFPWFGDFFFLQIGWINCSGMTRFNLWTIVSFRFVLIRIGDRRVFLKMYIAEGRKIAFGFVDGTDFLCCNIVITRISVL